MRTLQNLQSLRGRVALITGGAGCLGKIFAETLVELGASIVLTDRKEDVCLLAKQMGEGIRAIVTDLSDISAVASLPQKACDQFGRLDILINNAAFTGDTKLPCWIAPFKEQSVEAWQAALDVNLSAPFLLIQKASPFLAKHQKGVIINIGSIYGFTAPDFCLYEGTTMGNPAAYNASKAGLLQLTRYCATNLAPHVRVNSLSPGGIFRNQPKAFVERYRQRTPLNRMASEEDFKGAIAFLASDLSAYVTGQNLVVDGGWTAW